MIDLNAPLTAEDIDRWTQTIEDENLEFKTATNRFSTEELTRYCCALSNEGGGRIVFGMTPTRPREIVGSTAFSDVERTRSGVIRDLKIGIRVDEISHPAIARVGVRVVVFSAAARNRGKPVSYKGQYWKREGEELVPMSDTEVGNIHNELAHDFTAEACPDATLEHLSASAIKKFARLWRLKSGNAKIGTLAPMQLLKDADLLDEWAITYAALLLLGTPEALTKFVPDAEIIFEYRLKENSTPHDWRREYRAGYLVFDDELWNDINQRNYPQPIQRGLTMVDVTTFNERVTREAIANGVIHRDYRLPRSTFVRQSPRTLTVESPGGFAPGITPENIIHEQSLRNRRLAEVAGKCGLVERSGQGVNLMFEKAVQEAKSLPDYGRSTDISVRLTLDCTVQDPNFLLFLEQAGSTLLEDLSTEDFLALDAVNRRLKLSETGRRHARNLVERGLLETTGRGQGTRFSLSRELCEAGGRPGFYTRNLGLARPATKQLVLQHIESFDEKGSTLSEIQEAVPNATREQVRNLIKELKREQKVHFVGTTRYGHWHLGGAKDV